MIDLLEKENMLKVQFIKGILGISLLFRELIFRKMERKFIMESLGIINLMALDVGKRKINLSTKDISKTTKETAKEN